MLSCLPCAAALSAQEPAPPPADTADPAADRADTLAPYRADELLVRVTREDRRLAALPAAVSAVDAASALVAARGVSLADALRGVPGLFVQDRRNFSLGDRITVRGAGARAQFGVRGIRILVDGVPLTLPDGQSTLGNLDLLSAGRIEVLRGPASTLYGNAAGGVVAVTTEEPPPEPLRVRPRLMGGSHGTLQTRLEAAGRGGSVGWLAAVERLESDGFRRHSAAEVWRGNSVVSFPAAGGEARAVASLYHTPFAANPGTLDRETARRSPRAARDFLVAQGTGETATQAQGGLSLDRPLGPRARLRIGTWGAWRELRNPIPDRVVSLDRVAGGARAEVHLSGDGGAGGPEAAATRWTLGLDLEAQDDDRRESENLGVPAGGDRARAGQLLLEQRERVLGAGAFARVRTSPARGVELSAAGRLDTYRFRVTDRLLTEGDDSGDRSFVSVSPSAGVTWAPAPALDLWGRIGSAFQTPTTSELSNRPDGGGGFDPNLEPERVWSLEAGARGRVPGVPLAASVAAYRAVVDDALVPFEGADGQVFFRNAGEVVRSGLELSADWAPWPALEARLAWTVARARFSAFETSAGDFSGRREPGVPDQRVTLSATHRTAFGLRTEAAFRWVDAYAVNDANTAWNGSYRVVDVRASLSPAGGPARRASVFVGVDNALDERYNGSVVPNAFGERYYEPAPGRELYGGIGLSL